MPTEPLSYAQDRAAVVATTIVAVFADTLRLWLSRRDAGATLQDAHMHIEDVLRDEFHDIERQVRGERDVPD
jgi:hypothetical protein